MKKSVFLFIISIILTVNSFAQFEFKAVIQKEESAWYSHSYAIENSLFRLTPEFVSILDIENGQSNLKKWHELGGDFFNKENLKKSTIWVYNIGAQNFEGNLQFILHVSFSDLNIAIVKVEIDKNLKLVSHSILEKFKKKYNSQNHFKTNPKTKESVFIEYSKIESGKDFWRVLFFDKENELVSIDTFSYEIPNKNINKTDDVTINSIFVVSDNAVILNVNERLFSIWKGEFQEFDIDFHRDIHQYGLVSNEKGFSLVGHYTNFGQQQVDSVDTHGIIVLNFDNNLNQKSIKQYPLSNTLLANYRKQINGMFEKISFGYLDIRDFFFESNGELRIIANTVPTFNNGVGSAYKDNIILITINQTGDLVKTNLIPIKNCFYKTSLGGKTSVKVILLAPAKCYDKQGEFIQGCENINTKKTILVVFEFDKLTGELISRKRLKFNNSDYKINGISLNTIEIDNEKEKVLIKIFTAKGNNRLIGILK